MEGIRKNTDDLGAPAIFVIAMRPAFPARVSVRARGSAYRSGHTYEAVDGLDVDLDRFRTPSGEDHLITVATLLTEGVSMDDRFQVGPFEADPSVLVVGGLDGVGGIPDRFWVCAQRNGRYPASLRPCRA